MPAVVTLYSRPGCHLCDDARPVVASVAADAGARLDEIDITSDPQLVDRYGELIPVVTVDGVQVDYWRIDEQRLRAAVLRASR